MNSSAFDQGCSDLFWIQDENSYQKRMSPQSRAAVSCFWRLFQSVFSQTENVLISPLSVFCLLGMIANGAAGQTLKQIEDAAGLPLAAMNKMAFCLQHAALSTHNQLKTANSLWLSESMNASVKPAYCNVLERDYLAEARSVLFDEKTVNEINEWVSNQTDGMIEKIAGGLDDALAVLISALAFDGKWSHPYYDEDIEDGIFYSPHSGKEQALMMASDEDNYVSSDQFHGFLKPYKSGQYSFAALIPKKGPLKKAVDRQDGAGLFESAARLEYAAIDARLPQFSFSYETDLIEPLQKLGITDAFGLNADFSELSDDVDLVISKILQKARIEVEKTGTKAAAAAFAEVEVLGLPPNKRVKIDCNHPFLFMVIHNATGFPVLIGTVQTLKGQNLDKEKFEEKKEEEEDEFSRLIRTFSKAA